MSPPPNTAGVALCHALLSCTSLPTSHLRCPRACTHGSLGIHSGVAREASSTPHAPPCLNSPLAHSNFLFKKVKLPPRLPDSPLFLWRTLPYTILQMMNTVYVCALKFYLIAPFLSLLLTSPMPAFSLRFLGGQ